MLGVAPGVARSEARAAYLARATALHPDRHPEATPEERVRLERAMAALNDAWDRIEDWHEGSAPAGDRGGPSATRAVQVPPGFEARRRVARRDREAIAADGLDLVGRSEHLLGLRTFDGAGVTLLRCRDRPLRDDHVAALAHLSRLRSLDLDGCEVGDAALEVLRHLPDLRRLSLSDTTVTDAVMGPILSLPALRSLSLAGTRITDAALHALGGHPTLTMLNVRETSVRGSGLRALVSCPELFLLALSRVDWRARWEFAAARRDVSLI